MSAVCERHPGARRYPDTYHPSGLCAECKADSARARYVREHPGALIDLVNGDAGLAGALAARLCDFDLGLVALALRQARKAGRAAERQSLVMKRRRDRVRAAPDLGKQLAYRIGRFGERASFDTVRELREMRGAVRAAEGEAVAKLRQAGFSDAEIASELGIKKQAVQKAYPRQPTVVGRLENIDRPDSSPSDGADGQ